jgi:hypothetical protein
MRAPRRSQRILMHQGAPARSGRDVLIYSDGMPRLVVGVVIAALVFTVYSIVDCALTERFRVRGMPKALWVVVLLVLPVVGGVLWFLIGRGPARRRFLGPDDDPRFLGRSSTAAPARAPERDELALLEQELANLDVDPDDDGDGRRR